MNKLLFPTTFLSLLGCALMAGLFFAFSNFIMTAFGRLPPAQGIAAMNQISVDILTPLFLTVFMGTGALAAVLAISSFWHLGDPRSIYLIAGGVLYLGGVLLVTSVVNVPMNDALAAVAPNSSEGASLWADYLRNWTLWNHVRSISSLAATACFALALRR